MSSISRETVREKKSRLRREREREGRGRNVSDACASAESYHSTVGNQMNAVKVSEVETESARCCCGANGLERAKTCDFLRGCDMPLNGYMRQLRHWRH